MTSAFMTVFASFMIYLVQPLFPNITKTLTSWSRSIKSALSLKIGDRLMSIILALLIVIALYGIISFLFGRVRRNRIGHWNQAAVAARYQNTAFSAFKTVAGIVFLILLFGYGKAFIQTAVTTDLRENRVFFLLVGLVLSLPLWFGFRKKLEFLFTYEHEHTHMLMALLFFYPPKELVITKDQGGWIKLSGGNFLITLAPYFLPTPCLLLLPVFLVCKPVYYTYYFLLMGMLVAFHIVSTIHDTNFNVQSDLIFNGKPFSALVMALGNVFFLGFFLAFTVGGFAKGWAFISSGWRNIVTIAESFIK